MKRMMSMVGFLVLAATLPVIGVMLSGRSIADHFQFPPNVVPIAPTTFSWTAFLIMAIPVFLMLLFLIARLIKARPSTTQKRVYAFPWWGYIGIAAGVMSWILAWNRFPWFAAWQSLTFTPLWISYIVVVNALTYRRSGRSLLTHHPFRLLGLSVLSALFWWYFEHLNRYAGNWSYSGVGTLTPVEYFFQASLPFATVLPAVIGTRDWLATFPRLQAALTGVLPIRVSALNTVAWLALGTAILSLIGLGIWPAQLYPFIWIAPVLLLTALQRLTHQRTLFAGVADGDWRGLTLPALAALQCGFFWEMWNWGSLARWQYSVPWVHDFLIFEMPLLGYAGYLPFGIACAAISEVVYAFHYRSEPASHGAGLTFARK